MRRWDERLDDWGHRYAWIPRPVARWMCNWFENRLIRENMGTHED